MKLKIFVEGGGDTDKLKTQCRMAFNKFFEKATFRGNMPQIISCGGRRQAYDDFKTELKKQKENVFPVLLVDAEENYNTSKTKWQHLEGDKWDCPEGATEEHVYFMNVVTETWLIADSDTLTKYYGQDSNSNALPKRTDIENISKPEIYKLLEDFTKNTSKGSYSKGKHSFKILAEVDPDKVKVKCPCAKEMIENLKNKVNG